MRVTISQIWRGEACLVTIRLGVVSSLCVLHCLGHIVHIVFYSWQFSLVTMDLLARFYCSREDKLHVVLSCPVHKCLRAWHTNTVSNIPVYKSNNYNIIAVKQCLTWIC